MRNVSASIPGEQLMTIHKIKSIMYYVVIALAVSMAGLKQVQAADKIIKLDGSSTVYPISEAVAEEFQKKTGVKVTVGESGTGGGF
jgi:phosphate transport system substrate-binding protein